jgi:hypothetical protein
MGVLKLQTTSQLKIQLKLKNDLKNTSETLNPHLKKPDSHNFQSSMTYEV